MSPPPPPTFASEQTRSLSSQLNSHFHKINILIQKNNENGHQQQQVKENDERNVESSEEFETEANLNREDLESSNEKIEKMSKLISEVISELDLTSLKPNQVPTSKQVKYLLEKSFQFRNSNGIVNVLNDNNNDNKRIDIKTGTGTESKSQRNIRTRKKKKDQDLSLLQLILLSHLIISSYGIAIQNLLIQAEKLKEEIDWWREEVEMSGKLKRGWFLIQTLPPRLLNLFKTLYSITTSNSKNFQVPLLLRSPSNPNPPSSLTAYSSFSSSSSSRSSSSSSLVTPNSFISTIRLAIISLPPSLLITSMFPHLSSTSSSSSSSTFFQQKPSRSSQPSSSSSSILRSSSSSSSLSNNLIFLTLSSPLSLIRQEARLKRKELERRKRGVERRLGRLVRVEEGMVVGSRDDDDDDDDKNETDKDDDDDNETSLIKKEFKTLLERLINGVKVLREEMIMMIEEEEEEEEEEKGGGKKKDVSTSNSVNIVSSSSPSLSSSSATTMVGITGGRRNKKNNDEKDDSITISKLYSSSAAAGLKKQASTSTTTTTPSTNLDHLIGSLSNLLSTPKSLLSSSPLSSLTLPSNLSRPSPFLLLYPYLLTLPPTFYFFSKFVFNHRLEMVKMIEEVEEMGKGFWKGWVVEPVRGIWEVVRGGGGGGEEGGGGAGVELMGRESLRSELESLQRMVVDFAKETYSMTDSEIKAVEIKVREGDLTDVMRVWEKDIKSPIKSTLSGSLLRTLLIQVQKVKVDVDLAMNGIQRMLRSQQLTFAFVGVAPSMLIIWVLGSWLRGVWSGDGGGGGLVGLIGGRKERLRRERKKGWEAMRQLDSLLLHPSPPLSSTNPPSLFHRDILTGRLLISSHILRTYSTSIAFPFKNDRSLQETFLDDVRDMEDVKLEWKEKRRVLERMWRSWGGEKGAFELI